MSTTTEEILIPDEDTKPRSVSQLLALDTYQGMTDEEIDSLINWKVQNEVTERWQLAEYNSLIQAQNEMISNNDACNATLHEMVQQILDNHPIMQTIESEV